MMSLHDDVMCKRELLLLHTSRIKTNETSGYVETGRAHMAKHRGTPPMEYSFIENHDGRRGEQEIPADIKNHKSYVGAVSI